MRQDYNVWSTNSPNLLLDCEDPGGRSREMCGQSVGLDAVLCLAQGSVAVLAIQGKGAGYYDDLRRTTRNGPLNHRDTFVGAHERELRDSVGASA